MKFLNITNHPSSKWSAKQLHEAKIYGQAYSLGDRELLNPEQANEIIDIPFPEIKPEYDQMDVIDMAEFKKDYILENYPKEEVAFILLQGEMSYVFHLASWLVGHRYKVGCATSKRDVIENEDGTKTVKFDFCQFREY